MLPVLVVLEVLKREEDAFCTSPIQIYDVIRCVEKDLCFSTLGTVLSRDESAKAVSLLHSHLQQDSLYVAR